MSVRVYVSRTSRPEFQRLTPAISIGPTQKMGYRRTVREIRVQHPVNHKRRILVGCVVRTDYNRPEKIRAVFIRTNKNRFWKAD